MTMKNNHWWRIHIIVFEWQLDGKFEYSICVQSPSEENDSVEEAEVMEGWYDVNSAGCVLFEVFVFNRYFVISKGLFAFCLLL